MEIYKEWNNNVCYVSISGTSRGLAIEVNHVQAQIVEGNIPLKNGVLHIVESGLGVPTQTAWDFIRTNDDLR